MGTGKSTTRENGVPALSDGTGQDDTNAKGKEKKKPVPLSNYWRILSFGSTNDHLILLLAATTALASGVALPLMNIIFGKLVGNFNNYFIPGSGVTESEFKHTVNQNSLFIVYLFIGKFVLTYVSTFCFRTAGLRISASLRLSYMQALLAQPISKLDQVSAGTVSNTITTSANTIQASITDKLSHLFQGFAVLISAYAISFSYSWALTLVTSSALLFICLVLAFVAPHVVKIQSSIDEADAKHASIAGEIFSSIRTVFSLGAEAALSEKYYSWVDESRKRGLKIAPWAGMHLSPIFFAMYASFALSFWFGLKLYQEGHINSVSEVIIVIFSVLIVVSVLGNIVAPLMMIYKAISASTEYFAMIDSEQIPTTGLSSPEVSAHEDIVFDEVIFEYPTRRGVPVLQGFSARFQKGKTTALVGPSGSGKSTIVALLERWYGTGEGFHDPVTSTQIAVSTDEARKEYGTTLETSERQSPSSGRITCGGFDINSFQLKWWRTQIGLVQQEPFLFNDTIFRNVAAGLIGTEWESIGDDDKLSLVKVACKEAFADDFIEKLPDGYYTMVGESGIKLSGGQRQRIAIARSVVRRPAILILDEATSSIDVRSEGIVQAALDRVSKSRTTITIAHRLATIQKADHIIVLRDGRNIEEGTHSELMAAEEGLYRALVQAQRLEHHIAEDTVKSIEATVEVQRQSTPPGQRKVKELSHQAHDLPYQLRGFTRTFGRFVKEQKALYPLYTLLLSGIIMAGAAFSLQSYLFSQTIRVFTFTGSHLTKAGNFWSLMFFVLALGMALAYAIVGIASQLTTARFGAACRKDYFSSMIRKPIPFYDQEDNASGALMSRLSNDPKQLQELLSWNGAFPMISIFNLIGCIAISFSFGWKLTLVALFAAMPVVLISQFIRMRHELQFEARNSAVFSESSTFATEAVGAMRTVLSLTMEDTINSRYTNLLRKQIHDSTKRASYAMLFAAFCDSIELLAMALTWWYGGQLLASHEYNPVQFFVIYIAVVQGSQGAGQFLGLAPNMSQATASANRVLSLRPDSSQHNPQTAPATPDTDVDQGASIEFRNVDFQYPSRDTPVFRNLSFSISPGQFVAFVGASGCGKTSTISLLERFYDPVSGVILMNGVDVRSLDLVAYRKQLSLVGQEPKLFEGTIEENLLLGMQADSVTNEQLHQACKDAEIHDFILSLPNGYATNLGKSSSTSLSGGQKQRVCLARALLHNPKLLLLDEATSSLDSQSEKLVQAAIERVAGQRSMTVVAVAHRLATIQNADCIFVFDEGEAGHGSSVVEQGTHQELVAKRGAYWAMCQGQALDR